MNNHEDHNVFYSPATNEEGWKCYTCDEELGFRPDLDRKLIYHKVREMLNELHYGDFIYVSNGTEGDIIVGSTIDECEKAGCYDQHFIILTIMSNPNLISHIEYWRKESEKWI